MIYLALLSGFTIGIVVGLSVLAVGHITKAWETERAEWAQERTSLTLLHAKERDLLLQRIQAPEVAVADHSDAQREPSEANPWLGWDEDPETLTKEELAELE